MIKWKSTCHVTSAHLCVQMRNLSTCRHNNIQPKNWYPKSSGAAAEARGVVSDVAGAGFDYEIKGCGESTNTQSYTEDFFWRWPLMRCGPLYFCRRRIHTWKSECVCIKILSCSSHFLFDVSPLREPYIILYSPPLQHNS